MKIFKFFFTIIFLFIFKTNNAFSLVEVDITRGNLDPLPIAVSPLSLDKKDKNEFFEILNLEDLGEEISKVIENNLKKLAYLIHLAKMLFLQNLTLLI